MDATMTLPRHFQASQLPGGWRQFPSARVFCERGIVIQPETLARYTNACTLMGQISDLNGLDARAKAISSKSITAFKVGAIICGVLIAVSIAVAVVGISILSGGSFTPGLITLLIGIDALPFSVASTVLLAMEASNRSDTLARRKRLLDEITRSEERIGSRIGEYERELVAMKEELEKALKARTGSYDHRANFAQDALTQVQRLLQWLKSMPSAQAILEGVEGSSSGDSQVA